VLELWKTDGKGWVWHTSLASSRVNRGRVAPGRDVGLSVEAAAAAAAVTATTSGSVMVVAWDVSTAEVSKSEDGSGEPECRRSGAVLD